MSNIIAFPEGNRLLNEGTCVIDEELGRDLHEVKDLKELAELHDYEVYVIVETVGEQERPGTLIVLRKSIPDDGYTYRDLLINQEGRWMSNEY